MRIMPSRKLIDDSLEHLQKVTDDPSIPLDRPSLGQLAEELTSMPQQ